MFRSGQHSIHHETGENGRLLGDARLGAERQGQSAAEPPARQAFTLETDAYDRSIRRPRCLSHDRVDEYRFLTSAGQLRIQTELFYDYRTNVASYPEWQRFLRERQPPLLGVWGRYDPSFETAGAPAYRYDVPDAEIHILDAGHFALDEATDEIAALTADFLARRVHG